MKTLFVLLLLGTALAQNVGVRPADPQPIQVTSHPQTATVQVLSSGGGTYVASGEQVSGFPTPYEEPLGDAARRLRVEHDKALKAKISEEK
jgi:hypothetical protein